MNKVNNTVLTADKKLRLGQIYLKVGKEGIPNLFYPLGICLCRPSCLQLQNWFGADANWQLLSNCIQFSLTSRIRCTVRDFGGVEEENTTQFYSWISEST